MKKGDRVQTNAKFSKLFAGDAKWHGELLSFREGEGKKPKTVWRIRVDGMEKVQHVSEEFLVKEKAR